MCAPHHVLFL
jgi:hypothetical protein